MTSIFVFIPDVALREAVSEQITAHKIGLTRKNVESVQDFMKQAEGNDPSLIIIDEGAYDKKNAALLHDMLEDKKDTTLLLLKSRDEKEDDETVTETFVKPFRLGHLLTRLRYYVETAPLLRDRVLSFGPYRLEAQNRRILRDNNTEPVKLTEKETALLVFLADKGEPATRQEILAAVWGYDERIDTHTLETHIYQLRRKLDKDSDNCLVFEAGAYHLHRG
jgi:DNA-binding response OmpR family regulator